MTVLRFRIQRKLYKQQNPMSSAYRSRGEPRSILHYCLKSCSKLYDRTLTSLSATASEQATKPRENAIEAMRKLRAE